MRAIVLSGNRKSRPAVLVVGEGLIGAAVTRRLRSRPHCSDRATQTDWLSPSLYEDTLNLLEDSEATTVEVVWAAGIFGMSSSLEVDRNTARFEKNVSDVVHAGSRYGPVRLHLVGSAGALGCPTGETRFRCIDSPYKSIKSAEEEVVRRLDVPSRIHRVSSVYGTMSKTGRAGLVGMMMMNAIRSAETSLFARTTTMRNYIHADDVGEAIARAVLDPSTEMTLLASIRSHPMNEVVASASRVLRRPIPVSYRPPRNHHDMIFNPRAVSGLVPDRTLAAGMRLVYDTLVST